MKFLPLSCALAMLLVGAQVRAQPYPGCDHTPTDSDVDAAKGLHKAALQYNAKGLYERAITSWLEAYTFDCRAHRVLINIGNAYEKLNKTDKAIEAFETYLSREGDGADPTIAEKLENMKRVNALPNPTPDPVPQPQPLPTPDPKPNGDTGGDESSSGPGPWVLVGIGGAAIVAGAVLLGVGTKQVKDAEAICPQHDRCDDADARALGNRGVILQNAGGGVLGVGLAAVVAGVTWYIIVDVIGSDSAARDTPPLAIAPSVVVTPGFVGAGVVGRF